MLDKERFQFKECISQMTRDEFRSGSCDTIGAPSERRRGRGVRSKTYKLILI